MDRGKKYEKARSAVDLSGIKPVREGLKAIKELAYANFDESVDVDINLGIDASRGDQNVRGSILLPHGRGKDSKVLVFAKGEHADAAKKAGADYVGEQDLIEKIRGGWMDFDFAVATPDMMAAVGKVAKILGPRGLLPNKKLGTVTFDIGSMVSDLKKGRVFFKSDKQGLVHFSVGKESFEVEKLLENVKAFLKALVAAKPQAAKGVYLKKMTLTSTMGVGIELNPEEVLKA